ncbi:M56 family metallopeptidase [Streptomyces beihaiensis]|uniref:M56 family metallopeptidase n=1 Tax=Streptomyces beihaiensis TaxID=2984495 RepID=A0ABT3TVR4_9ACTN|nr:M56 family metallopeptidase [Streptomyces beihaiensis]MCX3061144.1 M56 family metallopeptidase [Streptomyces beihaiensis]
MHLAVYLPLLLTLVAPLGARPLAERCEPRLATWLLTASALLLGAASTLCLGLLAIAGLVQIPWLASLGHWSSAAASSDDPTRLPVALVAGLLLGGAAIAAGRMFWRRARSLAAAAMEAACTPARDGVAVVDDMAPDAFALPGLPGRVVVSTGMLRTLDEAEHDILLAHERAHLSAHHYAFVALAQLGAAANPLLRPLAAAVGYTVERWADERAAAGTGDRVRVARAVGKAALAARHTATGAPHGAALGILGLLGRGGRRGGRKDPLAGAGPVPRRVAALLAPPLGPHPALTAATLVTLLVAGVSSAEAAQDLHELLRSIGAS